MLKIKALGDHLGSEEMGNSGAVASVKECTEVPVFKKIGTSCEQRT